MVDKILQLITIIIYALQSMTIINKEKQGTMINDS